MTATVSRDVISLNSVEKYYGRYLALKISSLNIPNGIHWIQGVNGSGKTTLLKILAGLLPFSGDVLLEENISIKKNPIAYRRLVNYAEAEPLFPSFLTGTDLLNLFIKTKQGDKQQSRELIQLLNVNSFIDHPVGTYSSGMMKKLSLILASIGHPQIILLDEPLVTVDDASVQIVYSIIEKYHREKGITFLLTSHQHFDELKIQLLGRLLVKDQSATFVSA